jgi:8-oxo-dGTP pyrophosphatase MutT (NUDIX family)
MSFRLPAIFYKVAYQLFKLYIFIFRPRLRGVQCFVECEGRFLLVRHTYGNPQWRLPGGNMDAEEQPEEAARRELREEVGIEPVELKRLGRQPRIRSGRRPSTVYFHARAGSAFYEISSGEIAEARWFSSDEMIPVLSLKERYLIKRSLL